VDGPTDWTDAQAVQRRSQAQATLREHPLRNRLLPEEIIPHLEEIPNGLTRRIIITEHPNPGDPDYRVQYNDPTFVSKAEATSTGDTYLFQPTRQLIDSGARSPLSEIIKHEYSHHLRWQKTKLAELYDRATMVEPDSVTRSDGQGRPIEDFAINLGENLLHPQASVAEQTARAIPVRLYIAAETLLEATREIPAQQRGRNHDAIVQRAQAISDLSRPLARESLNGLSSHPDRATSSGAARLLDDLGLR
ncbi:MAG: hypothetical protein K2Z81_04035, partial [Cyanobacteria bacterium]|nr:hypothetical protein [Cyanobacteriota bacterium]